MTEIDPDTVRDLLPPMALYQQLDEIAKMADDGDDAARRFISWFAAPNDDMRLEVAGSLDFEEASRSVALFIAARAASYEFDNKSRSTMTLHVSITHSETGTLRSA
jgi:hypothetical protein